jgi:hypothetical protein
MPDYGQTQSDIEGPSVAGLSAMRPPGPTRLKPGPLAAAAISIGTTHVDQLAAVRAARRTRRSRLLAPTLLCALDGHRSDEAIRQPCLPPRRLLAMALGAQHARETQRDLSRFLRPMNSAANGENPPLIQGARGVRAQSKRARCPVMQFRLF